MSTAAALLWIQTFLVGFPCAGVDLLEERLVKLGPPVELLTPERDYIVVGWTFDDGRFLAMHLGVDHMSGACLGFDRTGSTR